MIRYLSILLLLITLCRVEAQPPVQIASKAFSENIVLGEMMVRLLEQQGIRAEHKAGLGGTQIVWRALLRGEVDIYPEYTGTLLQEQLKGQHPATLDAIRQALDKYGIGVSDPIGFNNSYGIGMRREVAERLGVRRISDLSRLPDLKLGFSHEFMTRSEGWPALKELYHIQPGSVASMEHELVYRALQQDDVQAVDLFTTDAEVSYYDLVVLEDDRHLFPRYDAVFVYRKAALTPALQHAIQSLAGRIDDHKMIAMNASVKIDKRAETEVAAAFLSDSSTPPAPTPGRFWTDTANHVYLVAIPLILTILVGVPLGVVAARHPRLGDAILAVCGVIQTVPSLALLIFMVPLLGIGYKPALVALFLYGLLPILRNTYTGLRDIPSNLLESADALGLPSRVRLLKVELPLAARSILAGIKTAAVINVGTATIGAIIGAGGYGEPIMMGVRRDDVSLLLQGAIPAAAMAIVLQLIFEWAERYLVPLGLQKRLP